MNFFFHNNISLMDERMELSLRFIIREQNIIRELLC